MELAVLSVCHLMIYLTLFSVIPLLMELAHSNHCTSAVGTGIASGPPAGGTCKALRSLLMDLVLL